MQGFVFSVLTSLESWSERLVAPSSPPTRWLAQAMQLSLDSSARLWVGEITLSNVWLPYSGEIIYWQEVKYKDENQFCTG